MIFNRFNKNNEKTFSEEDFVTKTEFDKLKRLVDTHHNYLNNIFIFYELEETPFLKEMRTLSYELMKFFDNVCQKHGLEYWLDYGTLLGAVRHGGFIPWDDDLDVGMMRADVIKLADIFQEEIDNNGLENVNCAYKIDKFDKVSQRWFQINIKRPEFKGKFVGIDVFPYDYTAKPDEVEEKYYDSRAKFYQRRTEGMDIREVVDLLFEELDLNLEREDYYISGVENPRGKVNLYPFAVMETEKLFPLQRLKFGDCELSAPSDTDDYLKKIYGKNYMQIPNTIRDHGRLNRYKKHLNIMDMLEELNAMFKRVNSD